MVTNLQIKFIKSLHLKKNRYEHRQYLCEGEKILEELIQNTPEYIDKIYATEEWISANKQLQLVPTIVSAKDMERMSGLSTPTTVLAVVNFPPSSSLTKLEQPIYLYLDKISDPGNLGTILRTADWFGFKQVFLSPSCVDIYSPKVIQAAMGSHFRIRTDIVAFDSLLQKLKFKTVMATAMQGVSIHSVTDMSDSLIVMGSESHGVSENIMKQANIKVTIPAYGGAESLNVSVATGIILYQFTSRISKFVH